MGLRAPLARTLITGTQIVQLMEEETLICGLIMKKVEQFPEFCFIYKMCFLSEVSVT